nr:uncharacterized mitochondrial protein AtMg00810-like [Tanacetum cinerariifolium]
YEPKESPDAPLVKDRVSDNKDCSVESPVVVEKKTVVSTIAKVEANYNYHQRERVVTRNNYIKVNSNNTTRKTHPSAHRNMAPRVVLMKTGLRPLNTDRHVNTVHPKTTVYNARSMSCFSKSAQSTVMRPYQQRTTLTNKSFSQKVNTAKGKFYTARPRAVNTARPRAVNTARPNLAVVNVVIVNQELDEGYVTFREGANGGLITCKGTLKTGKLDFENVYFVKELKFNLYSVSQMCDKKNSVLFTDIGCFVLSPDFKLTDESQVLLKVPRRNNTYNVDIKNILPKESLTCIIAKATLDESILWALVVKPHNKTPYELFRGRTPALSFMRPFGCHVTILNTLDHLGEFNGKADEGYFVGYSINSARPEWLFDIDMLTKSMNYVPVIAEKECGALNELNSAFENLNNEYPGEPKMSGLEIITTCDDSEEEADFTNLESSILASPTLTTRTHKNHPLKQEELLQFKLQKVCILVDLPKGKKAIEEGIDYDEVFAPVARIEELCTKFERLMKDNFQMSSMEELTFFLGLQVKKKEDRIFISHDKYVTKVLRMFNFSYVKSSNTPVDTKKTLVKDADGADVDVYLYRSTIGSLMCLTASRPDIMYAVCVCARFQVTPKVSQQHAVKRIFRYLKGHPKLGLWYPKDSPFELVAYTDSDYACASLNRKSITKGCQFLESKLISWQCKNHVEGMLKHKEIYVTPSHTKKIFANMKRQGKDFSEKHVTTTSNDPLLSGEDGLKLTKLIELFTQLQSRVFALETTKADQALKIRSLKRRVDDEEVGAKEVVTEKEVSTADPVPTVGKVVTTAGVGVSTSAITSQIFMDEITLAKALIGIKISKPNAKGIVIQEPSETPTQTLIDSSQPLKAKDKSKAKMIEHENLLKTKDQIMIDEEVARKS